MKSWVGHSSEVVESASHSELGMLYMVQMNGMILLLHGKLNGSLLLISLLYTPESCSKPYLMKK